MLLKVIPRISSSFSVRRSQSGLSVFDTHGSVFAKGLSVRERRLICIIDLNSIHFLHCMLFPIREALLSVLFFAYCNCVEKAKVCSALPKRFKSDDHHSRLV